MVRTRAVSDEQREDLENALLAAGLGGLIQSQQFHDAAFLEQIRRTLLRARLERWTVRKWRGAVLDIAKRFGATERSSLGALATAFLYTAFVAPAFEAGCYRTATSPEFRRAIPYLAHVTRDDDRVRENHQALHLFIARSDWPGWEREVLPPHGWNCRCRTSIVPWTVARELGFRGTFPLGRGKLDLFRRLGGQDEGFPRDRFVLPFAA